jgi:VWFA-related protein
MPEWSMRIAGLSKPVAAVALACCLAFATAARAQGPAEPSPSDDSDQQPVFQTEIEVVTVPVTVTDSSGEFVTDLNPGEFRLLDNGALQAVENFEISLEPVSMVIVAETSTRVQEQLADIGRSGILFTQLILGESGEAAVMTFDREVKLVQNFTENPDQVEAALKNLKAAGDDVRLSDALSRALFLLQQRPKERRKIIVALSEPRDTASSNPVGLVLRSAQQLGISIYTVGLSTSKGMFSRAGQAPSSPFPPGVIVRPTPGNVPPTPSTQANVGAANMDLLPIIAEVVSYTKNLFTGNPIALYAQGTGAQEFSGNDKEALEKALARIGQEVRNQYLLTYRPNNLDKPEFHGIQVTVTRPGVRVRTRPGYMYGGRAASRPATPANSAPSGK